MNTTQVDVAFTKRIGAGLFFATQPGPGRVLLQTMPFSRLADRILAAAPSAAERRVQEGGMGGLGGALVGSVIGGMLRND